MALRGAEFGVLCRPHAEALIRENYLGIDSVAAMVLHPFKWIRARGVAHFVFAFEMAVEQPRALHSFSAYPLGSVGINLDSWEPLLIFFG